MISPKILSLVLIACVLISFSTADPAYLSPDNQPIGSPFPWPFPSSPEPVGSPISFSWPFPNSPEPASSPFPWPFPSSPEPVGSPISFSWPFPNSPEPSSSPFPWPLPDTSQPSPSPSPMPVPVPPYKGIKGGYWPSWLAERFPPSTIPTAYFTHIFYAFVVPDASTYQLSITQPDDQWMKNLTNTLRKANAPRPKVLLSIGGGTSSPYTFSNIVSNPSNRGIFINSTIETARKYGFDGLDLDWEFPNTQEDMTNLSVLLQEWRTAIEIESLFSQKPRLLLTATVYFSSHFFLSGELRTYPGDAIKKYVDFVNPMCFNYHGSWDTSETGEHALVYDKKSNISTSYGISSWIKDGVPPKKLVLGLPLYGKSWQLKNPQEHAIGAHAVGVGPGNNGIMLYKDIVDFVAQNNATVVYDKDTMSAYAYSGTAWIGFDDPTTIRNKIAFAKAYGLGGYFFWALDYDSNWSLTETASSAWDGTN